MRATAAERTYHGHVERAHFAEFTRSYTVRLKALGKGNTRLVSILSGLLYAALTAGMIALAEANLRPLTTGQALGVIEITCLVVLAGALGMVAIWFAVARTVQRNYMAHLLRDGGSYLGPRSYRITGDGLVTEGSHGHALTRWEVVTEVTEEATTVLVWTDPGAAVIVPKNALGDAAEVAAFMDAVQAQIAAVSPRPARA